MNEMPDGLRQAFASEYGYDARDVTFSLSVAVMTNKLSESDKRYALGLLLKEMYGDNFKAAVEVEDGAARINVTRAGRWEDVFGNE